MILGRRHEFLTNLREAITAYEEDALRDTDLAAIHPSAVKRVTEFLHALPRAIPDPEVAIEPDGAVSLEWYGGYRKVASVSITESSRLAFAMINEETVSNGVYGFTKDFIDPKVLDGLKEIAA